MVNLFHNQISLWYKHSPGLGKLQYEQGSVFSYREVQGNLEKLNCKPRRVNNHTQIKRLTDQVGSVLAAENLIPISVDACAPATAELVVQLDGGHIPIQDKSKRSFEALSDMVYRPENIGRINESSSSDHR